jgi:L-seryl-tRNA(Ser) seleniumtransferase
VSSINELSDYRAERVAGASTIGGGSAPGAELPTHLIAVDRNGLSPDAFEQRLRAATPPLIARIEHDRLVLDLRTVLPEQDDMVLSILQSIE